MVNWVLTRLMTYISYFLFSYFKHIHTGYKFNKCIVLQFGPVKIKKPNKLFTNKLDKNIYTSDVNKQSINLKIKDFRTPTVSTLI